MELSQPNSSTAYPVGVEGQSPERFELVQLPLRVLIGVAVSALHVGLFGSLYFLLPIVAAVLISRRSGAEFLADESRWLIAGLEWVVGFYAYMLLVTDRFPLGARDRSVRLRAQTSGAPTAGQALSRLFLSIPHLLMLAALGMVAGLVWLAAAVAIMTTERCPPGLQTFLRQYLCWIARVLVYHASLVEEYPPFSLTEL